MTREEACNLESLVDKKFSEALDEDCKCSFTLSGKFSIAFDNNNLCLERDGSSVGYIGFVGWYGDLKHHVDDALRCFKENGELINKLIWSYEHIAELED